MSADLLTGLAFGFALGVACALYACARKGGHAPPERDGPRLPMLPGDYRAPRDSQVVLVDGRPMPVHLWRAGPPGDPERFRRCGYTMGEGAVARCGAGPFLAIHEVPAHRFVSYLYGRRDECARCGGSPNLLLHDVREP